MRAVSGESWTQQVTSVAIVHLDRDGIVIGWNPGAQRLKGYTREEAIGQSFTRFYRPEDRAQRRPERLLAIADARGSVEDTGWRVRADGGLFWAHVVITALRDDDGEGRGYVKIVTDLTAQKEQQDAELTFMRAFAHDFLSPITALRGYVDILEDPSLGTTDTVGHLATVADHLLAMAGSLSERLRASAADPVATVVDARAVAREAAELVLPGDAYGRLRFLPGDPVEVLAHPTSLRRALSNLMDNAAKYSDGPIDVSVRADGGDVLISVADRGRGIAAADQPRIFDPLERGRLADAGDGGVGMGLASTRALVEREGGQVTLESEEAVGTRVTVRLPRAEPSVAPETPAAGRSSDATAIPAHRRASSTTGTPGARAA